MRLVSLNCNGIRAAFKKGLHEYLDELAADIVCLQEVRANEDQIPGLLCQGQTDWLVAEKGGYSGVGVISQRPIRSVRHGLGESDFDREGRVQRLDFDDFSVVNVYIPSGTTGDVRQQKKYEFLELFLEYVQQVIDEQPATVVLGDFNIAHQEIDLKNWKTNRKTSGFLPEEREWLTRFSQLGLRDVVREMAGPETAIYSWWSQRAGARQRDVGWRLDYHWATESLAKRTQAFRIDRLPVFSDHAPVVVDYDLA